MHLYLSNSSHLNSSFTNDDGQVLYKVETPFVFGAQVSTVTCVVPNDIPHASDGKVEPSMQDRFAYMGKVEHNLVSSSVIHFGGNAYQTKDYLRKDGWGVYGRNRVFTAADGREYKWLSRSSSSKLITNDASKTLVAKFHRRSYGIIGKAHPASLEIFQEGEHMIQEILMTFIYIEKIRQDSENATAAA
ncbi:hypothetical protein H0H93_009330 [Arthromyces matolae]|nr:hypothetical protein H0H93_009330 [Arthromyces matolae]